MAERDASHGKYPKNNQKRWAKEFESDDARLKDTAFSQRESRDILQMNWDVEELLERIIRSLIWREQFKLDVSWRKRRWFHSDRRAEKVQMNSSHVHFDVDLTHPCISFVFVFFRSESDLCLHEKIHGPKNWLDRWALCCFCFVCSTWNDSLSKRDIDQIEVLPSVPRNATSNRTKIDIRV